jgi:hypothetical protein
MRRTDAHKLLSSQSHHDMKSQLTLTVALCVAWAGQGLAQRPDLSGVWVRAEAAAERAPTVATTGDASFRMGDMGSGWGSPVTITQRADSLIVEFPFFSAYDLQPPLRFAYATDGSESRNAVMIGHAASVIRGRMTWRDSGAVLTSLYPVPSGVGASGAALEVRQTLTRESATSLVVETTRAGVRGAASTTIRTAYTLR